MLWAEQAIESTDGAPIKRQSLRGIAQRLQAEGEMGHAVEGVGMLWAQHALAAVERTHVERQSLRGVAPRLHA